jgi:hypothetical protein
MYSGTNLKPLKYFDAWFGAHQKIDRVARRHLRLLVAHNMKQFPKYRDIMHFEGLNGPDGIKVKAPAKNEPWHYFDPYDKQDMKIIGLIEDHCKQLSIALTDKNRARAAFEAAWLAHAIVDGLTPAHHYPYEKELVKLRGGEGIDTRTSFKDKLIVPGETLPKWVRNNWKIWGDKGLIATHFAFEWGVAAMIVPLRLSTAKPTTEDIKLLQTKGIARVFRDNACLIADLKMYEEFYKSGWNFRLAKQVRKDLAPLIIRTVTLAWYSALMESKQSVK